MGKKVTKYLNILNFISQTSEVSKTSEVWKPYDISSEKRANTMAWIKTIPMSEADERLQYALKAQQSLYPAEYATPEGGAGIVVSHSLIPDALYHAFATFGVLMSPELPLTRRQHEMITTVVSATNRCVY